MHDQRVGAGLFHRLREFLKRRFGVLIVDADAAFHGDRNIHSSLHRGDAVADQFRLGHQASAEPAILHAIGRAAGIEIDLAKACIGADARTGRERSRIGTAKLQGERMLGRIETEQPPPVAMQHGARGQHLGIEQRLAREQTMEEPAMPVSPLHHRSD